MKHYRKFKRKHRLAHLALMALAIVLFWWALWGVLDLLFSAEYKMLGYAFGFLVAFFILYLDDFHLKELE